MKILVDGDPKELSEFFCLSFNRHEKPSADNAKDFWREILRGIVEGYKAPLQERENAAHQSERI